MISLEFGFRSKRPVILLFGAHCDDIEIGCGATVLRLIEQYSRARFVWVTLSSDAVRAAEARAAARRLLRGASNVELLCERFRASHLPYEGSSLKEYVDGLKRFEPDLVLTHFRDDLHQDHRTVSDLTWNSFRDHTILEYEIPKYDGGLVPPNVYVPHTRAQLKRKCDVLMSCFASQRSRPWFTAETFQSLARLRGIECNAPEGCAEAFHGRKLCLNV